MAPGQIIASQQKSENREWGCVVSIQKSVFFDTRDQIWKTAY